MKNIEVIIDKTGKVKITTSGFAGQECFAATAKLKKALGVVEEEKKTAEFFNTQEGVQQKEEQGYGY